LLGSLKKPEAIREGVTHGVGCRKRDGRGELDELMDVDTDMRSVRLRRPSRLRSSPQDLPITNAVFQCGRMMANRNCVDEPQRETMC